MIVDERVALTSRVYVPTANMTSDNKFSMSNWSP